jgi:hypothetical protein
MDLEQNDLLARLAVAVSPCSGLSGATVNPGSLQRTPADSAIPLDERCGVIG